MDISHKKREAVFEPNYICMYCGCHVYTRSLLEFYGYKYISQTHLHFKAIKNNQIIKFAKATIEHIVPRRQNGTNHLSNLGCACAKCNFDHKKLCSDKIETVRQTLLDGFQEEIKKLNNNISKHISTRDKLQVQLDSLSEQIKGLDNKIEAKTKIKLELENKIKRVQIFQEGV